MKIFAILIMIASSNSYSQSGINMLSDQEKEILNFSKAFVEEFVDKIQNSGDPEKLEALNKMEEVSKIKSYAVSKTLAVVVGNCLRVPEGQSLKDDFNNWVTAAKKDILAGYDLVKNGYEGSTREQFEESTLKKMAELEKKYTAMDEKELSKECKQYQTVISYYMSDYE